MAEKLESQKTFKMNRIYEQPPEAVSFYCDIGQVTRTENEIIMQFYETIPGIPSSEGKIETVKTQLRATITVSFPHAKNIGKLLIEKADRG